MADTEVQGGQSEATAVENDPKTLRIAFIEGKRRALSRANREYEQAKLAADALKKILDRAQSEYNAAGEPEDPPLLDVSEKDPDAWRSLSIDELGVYGVAEGTLGKMKQAEIHTFGDYHSYCNKHLDGPRAITGIGQGKADGIADAWVKFFAEHPEHCPPKDEADPDEPFNSQCGFTDKRSAFTFSKDGKSYTCPHCTVEFAIDDEEEDDDATN